MTDVDQHIIAEAAEWLVRMQSHPLNVDEAAEHQRWCESSPLHQQAWVSAAQLLNRLQGLPANIAFDTLNRPAQLNRRAIMSTISASMIGIPIISLGLASLHSDSHWLPSFQTATGQQTRIVLTEGTHLLLNTRSSVYWNPELRQLRLLDGELLLQNKKGNTPIELLGKSAQVRLIEGKLLLRQSPYTDLVAQMEGYSQIFSSQFNQPATTLIANQQARITRTSNPIQPMQLQRTLSAWETGMLVADAMPLRNFVEELGRYRQGVIQLAPELEQKFISGSYPILDTDLSLKMLAATYSLSIKQRWNGYWVVVNPV
ncbi:MAG: hypothetical protein B0W54_02830 [Cellvibrio sp. 79]|nr:MAG: hypothetical protein B0W54_02830 [Cellvibrio sp. 79]